MEEIKKENETQEAKKITVRPYLTYAEIEQICQQAIRFDTWSERETTIDLMLMHYVTNMPDEDVEAIGHEGLVKSGTIENVRKLVKNFDKIYEAISYTESIQRSLAMILKEIPEIRKSLEEGLENIKNKEGLKNAQSKKR